MSRQLPRCSNIAKQNSNWLLMCCCVLNSIHEKLVPNHSKLKYLGMKTSKQNILTDFTQMSRLLAA